MCEKEIAFIRSLFPGKETIPLHEPVLGQTEKQWICRAIDSGYVSTAGAHVDMFEKKLCEVTGAGHAVATVNGTAALHAALMVAGVGSRDEVLTQPLTFAATANAIHYCGAESVFLDVDADTFGLSPDALDQFLKDAVIEKRQGLYNRKTGRRIAACVPVHIFGLPCRIDEIAHICRQYGVPLVEDAAEALGTRYQQTHAGRFGQMGILSFNGNKIITTGGGGAVITDDQNLAAAVRHLTTTARVADELAFYHDRVGYNYRMPNLNAALGCAQLEQLDEFICKKRALADSYQQFFSDSQMEFVKEVEGSEANCWLNAVKVNTIKNRTYFLKSLVAAGIMARPVWRLMNELPMYGHCQTDLLKNAKDLAARTVCLPSSVPQ